MALGTLDFIFIVSYFVIVIVYAYLHSRKSTVEDFLIADRNMGVMETLASINAGKTGSILLIFTALLYAYGFSAIWYFIGVAVGYLIFIPFAKRLHQSHGTTHYTLADYFFHAYGSVTGKLASVLNIFIMFAFLILNFIASSKVLAFFTGWSFELSTVIVAAFVLAYLLMGGFKAVIATDVLQYWAIVTILFIFVFILINGVSIPAEEWNLTAAGPINVIGFFLIGLLIPFASPDLWQRVYASKSTKTLQKGIFYSVLVYLAVAALLAIIGLSIKTALPGIDPDIALIAGFNTLLPTGLVGLAVVVFFAAFMSTIDTLAYTASSSLVHDFFKNLNKRQMVNRIRIAIIAFTVLAALVAVYVQDLILGAFMFTGYVIILAIPTIATWIKPSIKHTTLNYSLMFGILALTGVTLLQVMQGTLTPLIILMAVGISLVGLLFGVIVSLIKH